MGADDCDDQRKAASAGRWFWLRDLETGLFCRICEKVKFVWIDAKGLAWQLCRVCDVDPSAPPRRRCDS